MVINKELLQLRKKIADKRPEFVRQESWRYDRLAPNWRKPKGKDNKMRRQVSGVPPLAKVGYKGPRKSRGLHPSGYNDILIFNTNDLAKIDPKVDAVRIAHTVGNKKRIEIVTEATKLKMKILNPGKVEAIKKVAKKIEKPKKESTTKKESPATTATTTGTKIEKPKKETKATTETTATTTGTKIEKPKKETATTTETKIEKPKKETKATTAKGKSTGKKGTK
jgi:large subunit ribosomal protein L32e